MAHNRLHLVHLVWFGLVAMLSWDLEVNAERLYHWTDESGEIHLTQEPPPSQGKLNDIMDYTDSSGKAEADGKAQPSGTGDPKREQEIMLELEKRRQDAEQSAIQSYEREKQAPPEGPNTCYVELPGEDMYVRVFNISDSGSRGDKIWSGWMKKYERRLFSSRRGRVSIDFKVGPDAPFHTHDVRICDNGGTIRLSYRQN